MNYLFLSALVLGCLLVTWWNIQRDNKQALEFISIRDHLYTIDKTAYMQILTARLEAHIADPKFSEEKAELLAAAIRDELND